MIPNQRRGIELCKFISVTNGQEEEKMCYEIKCLS